MNECVCVRETERDCCCVFEFVNQYAIILWSPEVLPVAVRTCADTHADTRTHTHTTVTFKPRVRVKTNVSGSNDALYLDDATAESDAA